ncbi:pyridoxamine 5'-phosphate oxidase family protein [Selenomonas artemidis]|jgi:FMN-binding protein|uniref:Pyridoxamine 5'-phosphate oxidase family protein n=1 Tax=Selenomonas artemidis F0399 TaxID=749551 RepID=E7N586_9FIRM|nr:pyridoxamine 5'-phosphate oxidase family protein [Selenomonas artemidis]EFW28660.1 pyridoxamine 5'-phosphate oxidase family protein [Selenomonas artemidis F0399]MBF1682242.1 pyridoxamine 5'-phosphate oxidase family protein [Selenomonas artemidis]
MLPEKFFDCLKHEGVVAIGTASASGEAHIANTWNSYLIVTDEEQILIPAAGMRKTEKNSKENPHVELTLGAREVEGYIGPGTGFLLTGTASFLKEGTLFTRMKEKCPFAARVLVFTPESCRQTL